MEFTFLVVDDEPIIMNGIAAMVDSFDKSYVVVGKAEDVQAALVLYAQTRADIVITDICMYEMGGIDLIKKLKKMNNNVRVIVISGHSDFEYVRESLKLGASDYLLKPIDEEEFKKVIKTICKELKKNDVSISDGKKRKILEMSKKYIDDNYSKNIGLKEVSCHVGISSAYLSELFCEYNKVNFVGYLTGIRIEKAKELLENPLIKAYEAGYLVGYDDPAYFSRVFKKHTGMSPSEFQNKNRNIHDK